MSAETAEIPIRRMAPELPRELGAPSRPAPLSLRRNISWTFAGNVVYAGCQWGMLVALAKLGTPEMVGQFTLALAIGAPIFMLANLQLRGVQATDARREYRFGDYLALRLVTTLFALLLIAAIAWTGGYRRETALVILAIGAAKSFESLSDVVYGLLQQHERMDRIARLQMVKGLASLAVMGITLYVTNSIVWASAALAASWALRLIGYDLPAASWAQGGGSLRPHWDVSRLARLAWLALPLGIVMMLISLNTNIPRYLIEHHLGERQLGFYAAMAYLLVAGTTVVSALGQSSSPRLAKHYAAGELAAFRRLLRKLVGIGAVLGSIGFLLAVLAGRPLLTLLYSAEYARRADVFAWLMLASALSYVASFLGYGMTAARYFRAQLPLFVVVTVVSALGCWWLVPSHGLLGAAWALVVSLSIQAILSALIILHALRRQASELR